MKPAITDDKGPRRQLRECIESAEQALNRKLSTGERVDLILDNFSLVEDSEHARALLKFYQLEA